MFSQSNGYSLSDIAAASGGNGGFGGEGGAWWIIILFLFCFAGWGGNGWNNGGNGGSATREDINYSFDFEGIRNGISGVQNGLADGFYSLNNSLLTGFAGVNSAINADTIANMQNTFSISNQLTNMAAQNAQCCCEQKELVNSNFATLNYNLATQACQNRQTVLDGTRDIIDATNANTKAILDFLVQDKIDSLNAENASLRGQISQAEQNAYLVNQLRPAAIPAYQVQNPYTAFNACSGYTTGCACSGY